MIWFRYILCVGVLVVGTMLASCGDSGCDSDSDCGSGQFCSSTGVCIKSKSDAAGTNPTDTTTLADVTLPCKAPVPGDLVINEILADPNRSGDLVDLDSNGDGFSESSQDEFVELVNPTNVAIALTGVELKVKGETSSKKLQFKKLSPVKNLLE